MVLERKPDLLSPNPDVGRAMLPLEAAEKKPGLMLPTLVALAFLGLYVHHSSFLLFYVYQIFPPPSYKDTCECIYPEMVALQAPLSLGFSR